MPQRDIIAVWPWYSLVPNPPHSPTSDYLTAKLADLKGDLVVLARKQDEKTNLLIEMLARKKVLGSSEVDALRAIEVFPVPRTAPSSA